MKQRVTVFTIPTFVISFIFVLFTWLSVSDRVYAGACIVPSGDYSTIQSAVNDPQCAYINVATGTYLENVNITNRSVTIQGMGMNNTIVDGNANDSVFYISGANVSLIDMTITNGQADAGGGILQLGGSVTISNSMISNNIDTGFIGGGGIYKWAGSILIEDTIIRNNSSAGKGGGIFHTAGSSFEGATITITNSLIENNDAWGAGGIYNQFYSDMLIVNTVIRGNTSIASGPFFCGGGIQNTDNSTTSLISSTVSHNSTVSDGGGICNLFVGDALQISHTAIFSNSSNANGGGIYSSTAFTMTNSTISNNSAAAGGGVYVSSGNAAVRNSTIVNNIASGIYSVADAPSLKNTLIAFNTDSDCVGSMNSLGHNLASDNSCNLTQPTDLPGTDPLIGPLENNGGPSETHALLFGSPAIDGGDEVDCPPTDQRGVMRPQGVTCDIGAYEFEGIEVFFDASIYSVEEDAGVATITITLDTVAPMTITVDYETGDGTATEGDDYTAVNGTATFAPGSTFQTFTISITADLIPELNETVLLTLTNPISGILGIPPIATLTLVNDDIPTIMLSQSDYFVQEVAGTVLITATLDVAAPFPITVDWSTADGTATAANDYIASSGLLFFAPGTSEAMLTIPILDDALPELEEIFVISLSNPSNANLGTPAISAITIINDDFSSISFEQVGYDVLENIGMSVITVTLDVASPFTITVDYTTSDGLAISEEDYTAVMGTLTFPPNITSRVITVPIINDDEPEGSEDFSITLANPSNAHLGTFTTTTVTLINDGDHYTVSMPVIMNP